jgi:hypothetical protein
VTWGRRLRPIRHIFPPSMNDGFGFRVSNALKKRHQELQTGSTSAVARSKLQVPFKLVRNVHSPEVNLERSRGMVRGELALDLPISVPSYRS